MKILLVAATEKEIQFFKREYIIRKCIHSVDFLVTGMGMVKTTWGLSQALFKQKYDWIINAGISGSFDREIRLGSLVNVTEDIFSEIGFEEGETISSFESTKMLTFDDVHIKNNSSFIDFKELTNIPTVVGITVNTVHGNEQSISETVKRFSPQVESMEGAAILYICRELNMKCIQLRSISNYIEKRNKESWDIDLAITNLNAFLLKMIAVE